MLTAPNCSPAASHWSSGWFLLKATFFFFLFPFLTTCHFFHSQCARLWHWSLTSIWHDSQKPEIVTFVTLGRKVTPSPNHQKKVFFSDFREAPRHWRASAFGASSRTNTDVVRSDIELLSPPNWLWWGETSRWRQSAERCECHSISIAFASGFYSPPGGHESSSDWLGLTCAPRSFCIHGNMSAICHFLCTCWNCAMRRVPSLTDSDSGFPAVNLGFTIRHFWMRLYFILQSWSVGL